MTIRIPSTGLALALLLASTAGQAAVARFDTTSFSYSVSNGALSWSSTDRYQALDTEALSGGGTLGSDASRDDTASWSNRTLAALTAHASATVGATAAQQLQGQAQATRTDLQPADLPPHTSRGYANQGGVFSLSEDGVVTFTIGWTLSVEGDATDPYADYGHALMAFTAGSYDGITTNSVQEELFSFDAVTGLASISGTWVVQVGLSAGMLGYYDLSGTASAEAAAQANAVPEPASLALVGAGMGLLLLGRRRAAKVRS